MFSRKRKRARYRGQREARSR